MRNFVKYAIVSAAGLAIFGAVASAQTTSNANANVNATIVTGINITNNTALSFGSLTPPASASGTAVISPAGARSFTGGVNGIGAGFNAANFTVTGSANSTYAITLPASAILTGPGANMTVNAFTSTPNASGNLGAGGSQALNVGGTLTVPSSQVAGSYTGTFNVVVAYN